MKNGKLKEGLFRRTPLLSYTLHGLKRTHALESDGILTLGRSPACDISIPHPELAPLQLRIERTSGGELLVFAEDENQPILVNGYPAEFKRLGPGDEIKIASLGIKISDKFAVGSQDRAAAPTIHYNNEFGAAMKQALKRVHWIGLSALLHLTLILILYNIENHEMTGNGITGIFQSPSDEQGEMIELVEDPLEDTDPLEEDLNPPVPEPEDFFVDTPETTYSAAGMFTNEDFESSEIPFSGPGAVASGGDLSHLISKGILSGNKGGGSKAWSSRVGKLRKTGIDIAILFDSTGSMEGFISEVKRTIREMVYVLKDIVPNLSLSLVTYKGDSQSSSYVVAKTPLVKDPFELMNFMRAVEVSGGSAEGFAAIKTALETACNELNWREATEKVVVIIGDAPYFPHERKSTLEIIRRFKGKVAAIYIPTGVITRLMEPQTLEAFKLLTTAGKGPFLRHDTQEDVVRRIVTAVLGSQWEDNVNAAFEVKRSDYWIKFVQRKRDTGDFDWFVNQFKREKVRPELVDAMVDMGGRRVAKVMWDQVRTGESSPWLMQRSLYVIQALTGIHIDYMSSKRDKLNESQLYYIADALKQFYGKDIVVEKGRLHINTRTRR